MVSNTSESSKDLSVLNDAIGFWTRFSHVDINDNFVFVRVKGIIFILLFVMTVNSLSLQQLFKIPVLIAHFFEHRQRNESITFIEYLSMHYWGNDIDDNDQDRDMQLPFKKADLDHSIQKYFTPLSIEILVENFSLESSYTILESQHHSSSHLGALFKPPRLA